MPSATQPSESDAAVHLVSGWTIGQLADTVIAFETHDLWRLGIVTDIQKFAALKRAVVLHTDVAALAMAGPKAPDLVWVSAVPAPHIGAALELVEWLREHGSGGKIFALDWYRTVAALLASEHWCSRARFTNCSPRRRSRRVSTCGAPTKAARPTPRVTHSTSRNCSRRCVSRCGCIGKRLEAG